VPGDLDDSEKLDNDNDDDDDDDDDEYVFPSHLSEMTARRASSNDATATTSCAAAASATMKRAASKPAPFMIRSYSMPVATQRDYDAQQRVERVRRSQHRALHESWSMSRTDSQTSSASAEIDVPAESAAEGRSPLRIMNTNDVNTALARTMSRQASCAMSRQATYQTATPFADNNSNASSSDETDVRTPRAVSPAAASSNDMAKEMGGDSGVDMGTTFFIHPDHLQKPTTWPIS
jgi:hypothetical protein